MDDKQQEFSTGMFTILNRLQQLGQKAAANNVVALAQYKEMPKLKKPDDYKEKIEILQGYYAKDDMFGMLVDMVSWFATDGHDWEVISKKDQKMSMTDLRSKYGKEKVDSEREEETWRAWDRTMNLKLNNVLPGTGTVDDWIGKSAQLTGMAALTWKYDEMELGDDRYTNPRMPMIMVNWPSESVLLVRDPKSWEKPEEFYTKKPESEPGTKQREKSAVPKATSDPNEIDLKLYTRHPSLADNDESYGSFVIKMGWSPGDVSIKDGSGTVDLYKSLYPNPPYERCIPWLMMRESMWSSDLQILDGLINVILAWMIGSKDHPMLPDRKDADGVTKKGDFTLTKEMIEDLGAQKVMEMFLPFWVEPKFIGPPTETLLEASKYVQATMELLNFFGIFNNTIPDVGTNLFARRILNLRDSVLIPFWEMLTGDITRRNPKILTTVPNRRYNPLPFGRDEVLEAIKNSHEQGELSTETYHRVIGIDPVVERARVRKEVARGDRKIYDESVPTRFKQDVVKGAEGNKQTTTKTTTADIGRKNGQKDEKQRKLREDTKKT